MYYITSYNQSLGHNYTNARVTRPTNLHGITVENTAFNALNMLKNEANIDRTWRTFNIPKETGGYRTIKAPSAQLKPIQRTVVDLLRDNYKILESDWSFAYVRGRCTTDANKRHTENESRYFLKLDIRNFFDSITLPVIKNTIETVYPTCTFPAVQRRQLADLINHFCLYEGRTPQGGVSSPFISNWVMTPYLYQIHKLINELATDANFPQIPTQRYIITCYADDITISAKGQFNWIQMQNAIGALLEPVFQLKREKTKYTFNAGRNHMLGKVLNKDHKITCGYKNKQSWKHIFLELINEMLGNVPQRSRQDRQVLLGQLNWAFNTEQEYLQHLLTKYETKFTNGQSILTYLKGAT